MADCFTLCQTCDAPIGGSEDAHQFHDIDCDRMLNGFCRCDGWLCLACCPDRECSPLAAASALAREDVRARAEAWEAEQSAPAAVERVDVPVPTGFYFGVGA